MTTTAVVLAGGPGRRLGELGATMPKAMIPVAGRPYLEHLVAQLTAAGMSQIVVAVHHQAKVIKQHFSDRARWPHVKCVWTAQNGTASDLLDCIPDIPTDVLIVWNGDTVVDLDIPALLAYGAQDTNCAVIVLTQLTGVPNQDAFYVGGDGAVIASMEAVPPPPAPPNHAWRGSSTGVVLLRTELLERFLSDPPASFEQTVVPDLIRTRHLRAYDNGMNYFLDFGTPDRLAQLQDDALLLFRGGCSSSVYR